MTGHAQAIAIDDDGLCCGGSRRRDRGSSTVSVITSLRPRPRLRPASRIAAVWRSPKEKPPPGERGFLRRWPKDRGDLGRPSTRLLSARRRRAGSGSSLFDEWITLAPCRSSISAVGHRETGITIRAMEETFPTNSLSEKSAVRTGTDWPF
jgi:hypothetical protein